MFENTTEVFQTHKSLLRNFDQEAFDTYLIDFRSETPLETEISSLNYPAPYPFPNHLQEWE